ncbi:hypothetical protein WMY93_018394 [Mugilogobius chulae]|uniref:CxC3 like cysteine cluster domain-containing protein n=1 Tax=Mugilogobius chulae TaxID=88201 RepID=A0AAW0NIR1_9GOBI
MAMTQLEEWLKKGRSLADEMAQQKIPSKKKKTRPGNVFWRDKDVNGKLIPKRKRVHSHSAPGLRSSTRREPENPPVDQNDGPNLEYHLQQLSGLIDSLTSSETTPEVPNLWKKGSCSCKSNFKMPGHFYLTACLETMLDGFFKPIPPTQFVYVNECGQYELQQQVCLLPIPMPTSICSCSGSTLDVSHGKQVVLITFNGPYKLHLPAAECLTCHVKWMPKMQELVAYRFWPATTSCQTLYTFDVLRSFEQTKICSPAFSQQAFLRMLEHRAVQSGREGTICCDTFHRSFREFMHCTYKKIKCAWKSHLFVPPALQKCLLCLLTETANNSRFQSHQMTEETPLFEGSFFGQGQGCGCFVDSVRSQMPKSGSSLCGTASFKAGKETSKKSRSKIDEEGLEVAVCRHGFLLRALNHYRGEIFAYPLLLQKEVSSISKVTFFCTDIACKYWPYLEKMAQKLPELQPLTAMRPFLSVMHAKAHTGKCEVKWGGRSQTGAGNTIGEEVEQVNSFLSRAALTTKYMSKAARTDMLTILAIGWNRRKADGLHKALASRYIKANEREATEQHSLEALKTENNLSNDTVAQWLCDVKQWAETEHTPYQSTQEQLQQDIESMVFSFRRKKHNLYRDSDSNRSRQTTRRGLSKLKIKLKEAVDSYNGMVSEEDKIDPEEACNLSANFHLPWERRGEHVGLRLKRQLFDQVMLVSRLQEEKEILLQEMMQHCRFLRKCIDKLNVQITQMSQALSNNEYPEELTLQASQGLHCCLMRKSYILKQLLQEVTGKYKHVATNTFVWSEEEQDDYGSEYSDLDSASDSD